MKYKRINLALQGGGAHGALGWGVLDALLEDGRVQADGICGTSAGAMNAVVFAHGLQQGGRDGARQALEDFWYRISTAGLLLSPVRPTAGLPEPLAQAGVAMSHWLFEAFTRTFSPYQFNPGNFHPLRSILEDCVDFQALSGSTDTHLFLCATNVRSGKVRIFGNDELSVDAVLASACLPFLFQAVEIDGEHYWDGGYMGNPALFPLFYEASSDDIVIVHINPVRRETVPATPVDIANRVNEISFNSSLLRELRAIEFAARMVEQGWLKKEHAHRVRRMLIHSIRCDDTTAGLSLASKLSPDWAFLTRLRDLGRDIARAWLGRHFDDLGRRSTVDVRAEFLD
jgi:NTE family protein